MNLNEKTILWRRYFKTSRLFCKNYLKPKIIIRIAYINVIHRVLINTIVSFCRSAQVNDLEDLGYFGSDDGSDLDFFEEAHNDGILYHKSLEMRYDDYIDEIKRECEQFSLIFSEIIFVSVDIFIYQCSIESFFAIVETQPIDDQYPCHHILINMFASKKSGLQLPFENYLHILKKKPFWEHFIKVYENLQKGNGIINKQKNASIYQRWQEENAELINSGIFDEFR